MKTSVALCTYNGERFLQPQLDSFVNQTRLPDEVVVCDDGSADSTREILQSWSKRVPFPVRIVQNPVNLGFAKNFEQAIGLCTGDVIFLSDQDDVWRANRVERMSQMFERDPDVGLVYCNARIIDAAGADLGLDAIEYSRVGCDYREPGYFLPAEDRAIPLYAGCLGAFRRALIVQLLPIPEPWPHDVWFFLAGRQFAQVRTILEPLMEHRRHGGNATTTANRGKIVCQPANTAIDSENSGTTGSGKTTESPEAAGARETTESPETVSRRQSDAALENDPLADYYAFVDTAQKYYYRESLYLFEHYKDRRENWLEFLLRLPESPARQRQLDFFQDQIRHFTRRLKGASSVSQWLGLAAELVNGGYFSRPEPVLSFLYDCRESIKQTRNAWKARTAPSVSPFARELRLSVVSAVTDDTLYACFFRRNSFIRAGLENKSVVLCPYNNQIDNQPVSQRYNEFLDRYDYSKPGWIVFCHQDWYIKENLAALVKTLDKNAIWGPIGSRLIRLPDGSLFCEHRGEILERRRNGKAGRFLSGMNDWRLLRAPQVDTLDCLALFVHSDLVKQYNLRFDPQFQFDLYVEDFCLEANRKGGILSRVVKMRGEHWSDAGYRDRQNSNYWEQRNLFNQKHFEGVWAGTCSILGANHGQTVDSCPVHCKIRPARFWE